MTATPIHLTQPLWRPWHRWPSSQLPAGLHPWLLDSSSLTQRLIAVCRGAFQVEVIAQSWRAPMRNESRRLGLTPGRYALVRQVYLRCQEQALVYARTVIPAATLCGPNRRLAHLKSRSLGAVLFADPATERGAFELARLTPRDRLYALATRDLTSRPAELWGRRARFLLRGQPLLVSEIFLPGVPPHPDTA